MSWEQPIGDSIITLKAEAALSAGAVVTLGTAAGTCKKAGTTDKPIGIAQNAATAAGVNISVIRGGVAKCIADGAFSKGDLLVVADANGEVDTVATLTAGSTAYLIGVALEAASGAGSIVPVALGQGISFPQGDLVKIFTAGVGGMTAGCAVKQDSTYGQAVLCTAATDRPLGIALSTVLAAATSAVQISGICDCKADAAYALADVLMVADANGELDTLAGNGALYSVGTAVKVAGGAGVITVGLLINIQLNQRGYVDVELVAGGSIAAGAAVKADSTDGQVVVCAAATDVPVGIAQNTVTVGLTVRVRKVGICDAKADSDYALGDELAVADANGELDTIGATAAGGATHYVVGVATLISAGAGVKTNGICVGPYAKWLPAP